MVAERRGIGRGYGAASRRLFGITPEFWLHLQRPGPRFHLALDIGQVNFPTPAIGASLDDGYDPLTLERL
jgi:hypothetical protein